MSIVIKGSAGPVIQRVNGGELLYFGGTSYLGLNTDSRVVDSLVSGVKKMGFGVGASRVTSGEALSFKDLETDLSRFFDNSHCVTVPSTIIASLLFMDVLKEDYGFFVVDEKAHPSIKAAVTITGKPAFEYKTGDFEHASRIVKREIKNGARGVICTDSVNPVDGSIFPIRQLHDIAQKAACKLFVDDAHGFGVLGDGRGILSEFNLSNRDVAYVASFSKALGASGGFLVSEDISSDIFRRSTFFTTSTPFPPFMARAISVALAVGVENPSRREYLFKLSKCLKKGLDSLGLKISESNMPFVAFSVGSYHENKQLYDLLIERQIWVPYIRYPTPESDGFFRMTVTAEHDEEQLRHVFSVLKEIL